LNGFSLEGMEESIQSVNSENELEVISGEDVPIIRLTESQWLSQFSTKTKACVNGRELYQFITSLPSSGQKYGQSLVKNRAIQVIFNLRPDFEQLGRLKWTACTVADKKYVSDSFNANNDIFRQLEMPNRDPRTSSFSSQPPSPSRATVATAAAATISRSTTREAALAQNVEQSIEQSVEQSVEPGIGGGGGGGGGGRLVDRVALPFILEDGSFSGSFFFFSQFISLTIHFI
jgi:hypothetical protein